MTHVTGQDLLSLNIREHTSPLIVLTPGAQIINIELEIIVDLCSAAGTTPTLGHRIDN